MRLVAELGGVNAVVLRRVCVCVVGVSIGGEEKKRLKGVPAVLSEI